MGGGSPVKRYSYFTRFARTEFHLRRGSPKTSSPSFRGFAEANFTREAYLTAEGDFTAASAARGGGSPASNGVVVIYSVASIGGYPPLRSLRSQPPNPLDPSQSHYISFGARLCGGVFPTGDVSRLFYDKFLAVEIDRQNVAWRGIVSYDLNCDKRFDF